MYLGSYISKVPIPTLSSPFSPREVFGNKTGILALLLRMGKDSRKLLKHLFFDIEVWKELHFLFFSFGRYLKLLFSFPQFIQPFSFCCNYQTPFLTGSNEPDVARAVLSHRYQGDFHCHLHAEDFQICFSKLNLFSKFKIVSDLVVGSYLSCFFICF